MVRHGGMRGGRVHSVNRLQYGEFVPNNEENWWAYLPSGMRIERMLVGMMVINDEGEQS